MSFNIATMLSEAARTLPAKLCVLEEGGDAVTYADLDRRSDALAQGLRHLGLHRGDRVAVHLPNGIDFVASYFAVVRAGMVFVPLNPQLKAVEIAYVLDDCTPRLFVTDLDGRAEALFACAERDDLHVAIVGQREPGQDPRVLPFDSVPRPRVDVDTAATDSDDTAVLIYTSGTTGTPKGAQLTHFQLYMSCTVSSEMGGVSDADVALGVLPLFHVFGLSTVLNSVVRRAATLVLMRRFVPAEALACMRDNAVTLFYGVPTMFVGLLEPLQTAPPVPALRLAYSGGASIPVEVVRRFERALPGVTVLEGYGMSETASGICFNVDREQRKLLSVGKPLWGVQVRVVDDGGAVLPAGPAHIGEVTVRGPIVMKGYFGKPLATAEAVRDGWLHTGDLGYLDDDGFLFIVDRKKELIIRGGYNVYPREVEEVLYAHPAVAEAAVVGDPDERLGEEVRAVVSLKTDEVATGDELMAFCRQRIADYKVPRRVQIVPELPKGPSGKILKAALKRAPTAAAARVTVPAATGHPVGTR